MRFGTNLLAAALALCIPTAASAAWGVLDFNNLPDYESGPLFVADNLYFTGFDEIVVDPDLGRVAKASEIILNFFGLDPFGNPQRAAIIGLWVKGVDRGDGVTFVRLNNKIVKNYSWGPMTTSVPKLFAAPGDEVYVARISYAYDLNVVPEPATWAMMIAGFGLVGAASRRKRRTMLLA